MQLLGGRRHLTSEIVDEPGLNLTGLYVIETEPRFCRCRQERRWVIMAWFSPVKYPGGSAARDRRQHYAGPESPRRSAHAARAGQAVTTYPTQKSRPHPSI